MTLHTNRLLRASVFLLFLTHACLVSGAGAKEARREVRGIPNFGFVTQTILRGGQPRAEGYRVLKELGVDLVISFREQSKELAGEREKLASENVQFVNIPWSGLGYPKPEQVQRFFALLDAHPDQKIFLHCQRGAERTGVMVALYRIARQGWSAEEAYREMQAYGFRSFWFRHLRTYVFDFARQAHNSPLRQATSAIQPQ